MSNKNIVLFQKEIIRNAIEANLDKKPSDVAIALSKWPIEERIFVVNQLQGRKKAKDKFPFLLDKEVIYPLPTSIEQTSSEKTARFKASMAHGDTFLDLSCGFGIDAYFIAQNFKKSTLVDTNKALLSIVEHNFDALNVKHVSFVHGNAHSMLKEKNEVFDLIYLDPSRRLGNKKVFLIDDCEPNILELIPELMQKSRSCLIKLSPMLDLSDIIKKIPQLDEIHVVALDGECKEILIKLSEAGRFDGQIHCVDLGKQDISYQFSKDKEFELSVPNGPIQRYLYVPNVAISKAGGFKSPAKDFNLQKISTNTHLYTSTEFKNNFPGKAFEVRHVISYNKKALKKVSTEKGFNIHLRNFPDSVVSISKKLGIGVSGKNDLFAYRNYEGKMELALCSSLSA